MNQTPFISILIPTWNRTTPVLEAIHSLGAGAFDDVEVIVVDNASDDAVYQALVAGTADLGYVRLFRNDSNLGMVRNWNACMERARGEWFSLLCSDDLFHPAALGEVRKLLKANPQPAILVQDPGIPNNIERHPPGSNTVRGLTLPIASGNFWHRDTVATVGPFDPRFEYSADVEYWSRIAHRFPVIKSRGFIARYRQHADNYMWATWRRDDFMDQMELITRTVAGYRHDPDQPDFQQTVEREADEAIWGTATEIVCRCFPYPDKQDILIRYLPIAFGRSTTVERKRTLTSRLNALAAAMKA